MKRIVWLGATLRRSAYPVRRSTSAGASALDGCVEGFDEAIGRRHRPRRVDREPDERPTPELAVALTPAAIGEELMDVLEVHVIRGEADDRDLRFGDEPHPRQRRHAAHDPVAHRQYVRRRRPIALAPQVP